ncbi:MAG: hypothetical protein QXQ40_01000 [Candidatus Aenigmatarchaeota archaeon]
MIPSAIRNINSRFVSNGMTKLSGSMKPKPARTKQSTVNKNRINIPMVSI